MEVILSPLFNGVMTKCSDTFPRCREAIKTPPVGFGSWNRKREVRVETKSDTLSLRIAQPFDGFGFGLPFLFTGLVL